MANTPLNVDVALVASLQRLEDLGGSDEVFLMRLPDGRRIVHKDLRPRVDTEERRRLAQARVANEILAFEFSNALGLDIVPRTERVRGSDFEVVSSYIEHAHDINVYGGADPGFDRRTTSLYVFDFLLNTQDRFDGIGNMLGTCDRRVYAIDHEWILDLGAIPRVTRQMRDRIGPVQIEAFFSSEATQQAFFGQDWGAFIEAHLEYRTPDTVAKVRQAFLDRMAFIKSKWLALQASEGGPEEDCSVDIEADAFMARLRACGL